MTQDQAPASYTVTVPSSSTNHTGPIHRHRLAPESDVVSFTYMPNIKTLYDALEDSATRHPKSRSLGYRVVEKMHYELRTEVGVEKTWTCPQLSDYHWLSYEQVQQKVATFASGLVALGFQPKDKLCIYEETCLEWTITSQAVFRQSGTILTLYSNLGQEALQHVFKLGSVDFLVTNANFISNLIPMIQDITGLKGIIYIGQPENNKAIEELQALNISIFSYESVEQMGRDKMVPAVPPSPQDTALIMFTSGTTCLAKGVALSHFNVISAIAGAYTIFDKSIKFDPHFDIYISYLPLAHILAFAVHILVFCLAIPIGYGSPRTLTDAAVRCCSGDLKALRPTFFVGVAAVYERIKIGIERKVMASGFIKRNLFNLSYSLKSLLKKYSLPGSFLLDALVFNRTKAEVGGQLRICISGGSSLSPKVQDFMDIVLCCTTLQGYGLTETSGPACIQEISDRSRGCVGPPSLACEIRLADVPEMNYYANAKVQQGEICFRGSCIFSEYYMMPDETKEAFKDGWFHSGDVGEWTPQGTLRIIDRIKNLIKPPHGEYIALECLESRYGDSTCIEQICLYVDEYHSPLIGLVVPHYESMTKFAAMEKIPPPHDAYTLSSNSEINHFILKELQNTAKRYGLKSIEMIRAVALITEPWTVQNSMLTAAQKLKRNAIVQKYRSAIDEVYKHLERK